MNLTNPDISTTHIDKLDTTAWDTFFNAINSEDVSIGDVIKSAIIGFFGVDYYQWGILLVISGIVFLVWQDHKSPQIPAAIILLFGGVIFTLIPAITVMPIKILAIMAIAGIIVKVYMDR